MGGKIWKAISLSFEIYQEENNELIYMQLICKVYLRNVK